MLIALLTLIVVTLAGFAAWIAIYACLPAPEYWRDGYHGPDCLCADCEED